MDRKKVTRRTALGMITGGAIMTATGTVAFSDISGSRTASVNVADDPNAYLAIENADIADETSVFTNLTNVEMEVTLDSDDLDYGGATPEEFTLGAGESQEVEIDGTDSPVSVQVDAVLQDGGSILGNIELEREFAVPQVAAIEDVEGTVNSRGSGAYEFTLTNPSDVPVELVGVGVDWTNNPDAYQVGGHNPDGILLFEDNSVVDSTIVVGGDVQDLTQTVTLEPGEEYVFEFDRFREEGGGGGSQAPVQDADVVLEGDEGQTTVELRA